jgi:hypothetical protein
MKIKLFFNVSKTHKARRDVCRIISESYEAQIIEYTPRNGFWGAVLSASYLLQKTFSSNRRSDIFFVQFPPFFYEIPAIKLLSLRKFKIVFLIHDLDFIRGIRNLGLILFRDPKGFKMLRQGQVIAHNEKMKQYLELNRVSVSSVLPIFDYLNDIEMPLPIHSYPLDRIENETITYVFAGNLDPKKSGFLYNLPSDNIGFDVYGKFNYRIKTPSFNYLGEFSEDNIPELDASIRFGVVWDGLSSDGLVGNYGEYLRINSPHKISLYLAMGMPVVVHQDSALATFVTNNGLGFAIRSLAELPKRMSPQNYRDFVEHVAQFKSKIDQGEFLLNAIDHVLN